MWTATASTSGVGVIWCRGRSARLLVVDVELEHDEVARLVQAAHDVQRVARRRGVRVDREVEQVDPLVQARRDLQGSQSGSRF